MQYLYNINRLSLLLSNGGFPLAGGPYAALRRVGDPTFTESLATAISCLHDDGICWNGSADLGALCLFFTVQLGENGAVLSGHIQNTGHDAVEVARVHSLRIAVFEKPQGRTIRS